MNPKSYDDDELALPYNKEFELIEKMQDDIMKQQIEKHREQSKKANQAYNDLCDALGVDDLNATIDGTGSHVRIPVDNINAIVARIQSLKTNVLAEGAL
jgi:hypothetical protein